MKNSTKKTCFKVFRNWGVINAALCVFCAFFPPTYENLHAICIYGSLSIFASVVSRAFIDAVSPEVYQ